MYKGKKCLYCKVEHNNKKFCSNKCALRYNWNIKKSPYRTKEYSKDKSKFFKKWHSENEHPRGMLGKKQSQNAIDKSRERCKKRKGDKHPYWKGGSQVYWNNIARRVMKDVPNICWYGKKFNKENECKGKIVVHHKDKNITNNIKSNLIKVCEHHHLSYYHKEDFSKRIKDMNKKRLKKIKENPEWWKEVRNKIRMGRKNENKKK
jgi:hypothetical protein